MNSATILIAKGDWTLAVNWCAFLLQVVLLNLAALLLLAAPIALVIWNHFRLRGLDAAIEGTRPGSAAQSRLDPDLGFVYESAPADADDLRQIVGVGAVIEAKLHDFGVYKFRQIAGWSDEVSGEFGRRLAFSDRVVRDDWRAQAAKLHTEKHGAKE